MIKDRLQKLISHFVDEYQKRNYIKTSFGAPLLGLADAMCPEIRKLREIIGPDHLLPQDIMEDASLIVSYYVPFTKELLRSCTDYEGSPVASPEWARAYEELNNLFSELNPLIIKFVEDAGFSASTVAAASTFDSDILVSNWSHRHIAYAAGLGTFGINNMLITPKGCCGRYNSVVTNIPLSVAEPDGPLKKELCLYKQNPELCGVCIRNCPGGVLNPETCDSFNSGFDRQKCFAVCQKNAELYPVPAPFAAGSYSGHAVGSQVCGKCVTASPCAFMNRE